MFALGWSKQSFDRFNTTHFRGCALNYCYDTRAPTAHGRRMRQNTYWCANQFLRSAHRFTLHNYLEDTY